MTSSGPEPPLRLLTVGASTEEICGVRDFARVMRSAGASAGRTVWWERSRRDASPHAPLDLAHWLAQVDESAESWRPDALVWHYSVFSWGWHGIPVHAPSTARRLASFGPPLVVVLHEIAFPWGAEGARGVTWAMSQRAALVPVVHYSALVVVTTERRQDWLRSRRWLPRRPIEFVPVCPTIPLTNPRPVSADAARVRVGILGFGGTQVLADDLMRATADVERSGTSLELVFVGSPGAESPAALAWRAAAKRQGCASAITFTGLLDPDTLAAAVHGLDIAVLADPSGPSSRKTTLAAALALGVPVVAVDGPERWDAMVDAGAVALVPPDPERLAQALRHLLGDPAARTELSNHGLAFASGRLSPSVVARRLEEVVRSAVAQPARQDARP